LIQPIRHIRKFLIFLIIAAFFGLPICSVTAQNLSDVVGVSYIPARRNVVLKYTKTPQVDRFTFDFPEESKITYDIQSSDGKTTIIFSRVFRLDTVNLTDYSQAAQITQRKLSGQRLEITFPQPLAASIEHLNSIVLDLNQSGADVTQAGQQKITPMQISTLGFSWNTPVALAIFKRGKYLWIIFNQYQKMDIHDLEKSAGSMVKDILQMPHTAATILRLEATDELYSEVRREGLLWVIDLYNQRTPRDLKPIKVTTDTTLPEKPYIQVDLPHTEDVFSFLDPEVGDMLMAITSSETGYAFLDGYKYPDFELLPTSQGMAVNSDDYGIGLIRNANGFMLQTLQHPLNLSKNLEHLKNNTLSEANTIGFSLAQEMAVPIIRKTFSASEKFLKDQIQIAPEAEKNKFRIELARFYLSHGLGSNALGLLRLVQQSELEQNQSIYPRTAGLIGVASFLMHRYDVAFDIFNQPELNSSPEIKVWRALSDNDADRDLSFDVIKNPLVFQAYPVEVKKRLIHRGLEYAVQKKNDALIQTFLNLSKEIPADPETVTFAEYYEAEKLRLQGYLRNALPKYKNAAQSLYPKISAFARFRIADFDSQLVSSKNTFAIQEFERLKFAWGEKTFKINVLNKLVSLYLKTGNFYMALKTLNIITHLSSEQKSSVERQMIQIMEEIYYYNNDNEFNPIKALALFDDFGYLIERSPHQTAIIIKLADRLVAIDLLDRAYHLINDYLQANRQRLSKQEISAMGSRLALIDMFHNDYDAALRNLYDTQYDDISETLRLQRIIIEAKAYVEKGLPDKALNLLENNTSRNAILLKSEIYWNAEKWDEASDMLHLLIEKPQPDTPIDDEQMRYILDWLTALKQAGKETVIVRIKNTFKPYFEKTPYAGIFNILTDNLENDTISLKDIHKTIRNIQVFSDFTKQFMRSVLSQPLTEQDDQK